ncbi:MAG: 16S rRNA (cytosine(967)-C(5))-methyltransferase RsmB [Ignavibacteriaceae bacterium]|nr:16S rRNA (cytosine(967)-C(5))-methyltransferase RsmB [Ignavibacterium sp.]MCC6256484.1 16S rRNA (cytosine(967)-C(5))-methyltransferase RsmB [Ignavibacteriaceae bacterium]HMN23072.1 16S rRNA (cytosine(967)-C(5))-methyltransferase RsmB [Ignavibacteriaceae bacterium]HRN26707.1 16S rRNA (cytosine(967)-C(5))-methyltransferase RsmB [Ignavibacteriaceae bacterium]HRP91323.1 16S rRNA (cytosine(967)-C(5))-methyltransferase RsmB [Ignavibacteriaceae bacterium]
MEDSTDQNIEPKLNEPNEQITDDKNDGHLEEHKVIDLYQGVRGLAVKILNRVERTDAYLDKLLDNELRNAELNGPDKALLYEIVHGVTRWEGRLDWILNGFYKGQFSKAIPNLKNGLRVALYQILFLDRIPDHAAVNEAVEFVKKLQGQKPADLTNAILRNIIRNKNSIRYPDPNEDIIGYLSAYYSHPAWMVKRYLERFGREDTEKLLNANNEKPYLTLRINAIKTNPQEFKSLLQQVNLKYRPGKFLPEFVQLQNLTNITAWEYFVKGYFNIQDESAGLAVRLLDVAPGMNVLDMCAAPGGKTAYLGSLMNNEGSITALDRYEGRLKLVRKNNERLGLTCVTTIESDALEFESEPFDRVLADVPCSGSGTLSKKPDIKWKKDIFDLRKMSEIQLKLIAKASTLVKPGGVLVYSTCSIEPEENIEVVKKFLESHPNFKLESAKGKVEDTLVDENGCIQTLPQKHQMDGAFAAKLIRID